MIIDTDAGGDDGLAIMLALMYEAKTNDIEILAITATYGNTYLKNVEQNILKILTIANRSDVSTYLTIKYFSHRYFVQRIQRFRTIC